MFHENLKNIRKQKGFSQEQLAVRLNVVRQTVSKWEKAFPIVKDTTPNMTNPRLYRTAKDIKA